MKKEGHQATQPSKIEEYPQNSLPNLQRKRKQLGIPFRGFRVRHGFRVRYGSRVRHGLVGSMSARCKAGPSLNPDWAVWAPHPREVSATELFSDEGMERSLGECSWM